ncbi:MAG: hypothetical protein HeimC3_55000 [Candidatus Heimdallarchaeota archaeon LC_3]|nr:MAG: hypothetical protein HeimC3_55000 [Candidatus Heimdallarchaeota archaeon LC_3]
MYKIEHKREDINFDGNKSEVPILDFTILNRLQVLSFELQSILYNFNKSCASTKSKKAIYLETYVNYIGEIFNQSILSNQGCQKKNLEKEIIYNR